MRFLFACPLVFMITISICPLTNQVQVGESICIHSTLTESPVVEPHLSVHPTDSNHMLIAAMVITDIQRPYQSGRLTTFSSTNGGQSWKETLNDYWGYDPWTCILPSGQSAVAWLGTEGKFQHEFPVQLFQSTALGVDWNKPQTIASRHGHDGTKIAAGSDRFYFTTVQFNDDMSADVVMFSAFPGKDFVEVARVKSGGVRLNFCEPVVLGNGSVVLPSSHFLKECWVQIYHPATNTLSEKYLVTHNAGGAKGYMRMTGDQSQGPYHDRLYLIRALGSGDQYEGVWLNYSTTGGKTWSPDIRVDQFPSRHQSHAMLASIDVDDSGIVGISWIDRRPDSSTTGNDLYFTYSTDGGLSFHNPIRITDKSTNPKTRGNADVANKFPGGGHYMDIKGRGQKSFQLVWSDSRTGHFQLQTCRVDIKEDL